MSNSAIVKVIHTGVFGVNTCIVPLKVKEGDGVAKYCLVIDSAASAVTQDESVLKSALGHMKVIAHLLTHGHFDHIMGTGFLKEISSAPILIHKKDTFMVGRNAYIEQRAQLGDMGLGPMAEGLQGLPDADVEFFGGETLDALIDSPSEEIASLLRDWLIIHTPGHTPGSSCFYNEKEGILISGDTVFFHSWGRTDFPGGSESQMQKSLKMLYKTLPPKTLVYPGHETYAFELGENLE